MSGRYLLDTNIVIALFANESQTMQHIEAADAIMVPIIVIGELYYGANRSSRRTDNLKRIEEFAFSVKLLDCCLGTAHWYGIIKDDLRKIGCPIPENDIWIAAIAKEHDLILVSRDEHFKAVSRLKMESW